MGRIEALTRALNSLKKVGIRTRTDVDDGDAFGKWHQGPADKNIGDSKATVYASLAGKDRPSEVWRQKAPHDEEYQGFLASQQHEEQQQKQQQQYGAEDAAANPADGRPRKARPDTVTSYTVDLHDCRSGTALTASSDPPGRSSSCCGDPATPEQAFPPPRQAQSTSGNGLQVRPPNPSSRGGGTGRAQASLDSSNIPPPSAVAADGGGGTGGSCCMSSSSSSNNNLFGSSNPPVALSISSSSSSSSPLNPQFGSANGFRRQTTAVVAGAEVTGATAAVRLPSLRHAPQSQLLSPGGPQTCTGAGPGPGPGPGCGTVGRAARIVNASIVQGGTTPERAFAALVDHAGLAAAGDSTAVRQLHPQPPPGQPQPYSLPFHPQPPPPPPQQMQPFLGQCSAGPFLDERDVRSAISSPPPVLGSTPDRPGGSVGAAPRRRLGGSAVGSGLPPPAPTYSPQSPLTPPLPQQLHAMSPPSYTQHLKQQQQQQRQLHSAFAALAGRISNDVFLVSPRQQSSALNLQPRPLSGGTIAFANGSSGSSGFTLAALGSGVGGGGAAGGGGVREESSRGGSQHGTVSHLDEAIHFDIVEDTGRWFDAGDLSYCNPDCEEEMAQILGELVTAGRRIGTPSRSPSRSCSFTRGGSLGRVPSGSALAHQRSLLASPPQGVAPTASASMLIAVSTSSPTAAGPSAGPSPAEVAAGLPAINSSAGASGGSGGPAVTAAAAAAAVTPACRGGGSGSRSPVVVGAGDAGGRGSDSLLPRLHWLPPSPGSPSCPPAVSATASPGSGSPMSAAPSPPLRGRLRASSTICNIHDVDFDGRMVDGEDSAAGAAGGSGVGVSGAVYGSSGGGGGRYGSHSHRRSSQLLIQAAGRRASTGLPPGLMVAVSPSGLQLSPPGLRGPTAPAGPRQTRNFWGSSSGPAVDDGGSPK